MSAITNFPKMPTDVRAELDVNALAKLDQAVAKNEEVRQAVIDESAAQIAAVEDLGTELGSIQTQLGAQPTAADLVAAQNAIIAALDQPGIIAAVTTAGSNVQSSVTSAKDDIILTLNNNSLSEQAKADATNAVLATLNTAVGDTKAAIEAQTVDLGGKLDGLALLAGNAASDRATAITQRGNMLSTLADIAADSNLIRGDIANLLSAYKGFSEDDSVWTDGEDFQAGVTHDGTAKIITIPAGWTSVAASVILADTPDGFIYRRFKRSSGAYSSWLKVGQGFSSGDNQTAAGMDVLKRRETQFWIDGQTDVAIVGLAVSEIDPLIGDDVDGDKEPDDSAAPVVFTVTDNGSDPAFADFAGGYSDSGEVGGGYGQTVYENSIGKAFVQAESNNGFDAYFDSVADAIADTNALFIQAGDANDDITDFLSNVVGSKAAA